MQYCALGRRPNDRHSLRKVEDEGLTVGEVARKRAELPEAERQEALKLCFNSDVPPDVHEKALCAQALPRDHERAF